MRMFIVGMLFIGSLVHAETVSQNGVHARAVNKYVVHIDYNGRSLGNFNYEELQDLSRALTSARRLIKRPSTREMLDYIKSTAEGRKRIQQFLKNGK